MEPTRKMNTLGSMVAFAMGVLAFLLLMMLLFGCGGA